MVNFYVGQKVVCVDDAFTDPAWVYVPNKPIRGSVYTVSGKRQMVHFFGIYLVEITNPLILWEGFAESLEHAFPVSRFRPVKTTDISIFTKMRAPTPKERELA